MITRLIIARHGNTCRDGEIPRRIGKRTDMPLVESTKSRCIGKYLKQHELVPHAVFAAPLTRTMQSAQLAIDEMQADIPLVEMDDFSEIDYGPDENQTEENVCLRLGKIGFEKNGINISGYGEEAIMQKGKEIIKNWDKNATVPDGWIADRNKIIQAWKSLALEIENNFYGKNILIFSSNGIIRFAPHLTGNFEDFAQKNNIKLSTGAISIFEKRKAVKWQCAAWNIRPGDFII